MYNKFTLRSKNTSKKSPKVKTFNDIHPLDEYIKTFDYNCTSVNAHHLGQGQCGQKMCQKAVTVTGFNQLDR